MSNVNSSERLRDYPRQYEYSIVTSYNYSRQVRHRGAGIFLHVNGRGATAGCVSAPRWFLRARCGRPRPRPAAGDRDRPLSGPCAQERTEVRVDVEGRTLTLVNLEKVMYPRTGTTKGEVLDYYARVAPAHAAACWPTGP